MRITRGIRPLVLLATTALLAGGCTADKATRAAQADGDAVIDRAGLTGIVRARYSCVDEAALHSHDDCTYELAITTDDLSDIAKAKALLPDLDEVARQHSPDPDAAAGSGLDDSRDVVITYHGVPYGTDLDATPSIRRFDALRTDEVRSVRVEPGFLEVHVTPTAEVGTMCDAAARWARSFPKVQVDTDNENGENGVVIDGYAEDVVATYSPGTMDRICSASADYLRAAQDGYSYLSLQVVPGRPRVHVSVHGTGDAVAHDALDGLADVATVEIAGH